MMSTSNKKMFIVSISVIYLLCFHYAESCDLDQTRQGCKIQNRACSCGFGCKSEYRYPTKKDCEDALKGKRIDVCFTNPCLNGGSCLQISLVPGYRCRCEGTGYYGPRCQKSCPVAGTTSRGIFPYECVVI